MSSSCTLSRATLTLQHVVSAGKGSSCVALCNAGNSCFKIQAEAYSRSKVSRGIISVILRLSPLGYWDPKVPYVAMQAGKEHEQLHRSTHQLQLRHQSTLSLNLESWLCCPTRGPACLEMTPKPFFLFRAQSAVSTASRGWGGGS